MSISLLVYSFILDQLMQDIITLSLKIDLDKLRIDG
jgi:hypothetical protein